MNKAIIYGHLGKDPEVRNLESTTVAKFSLATNSGRKDKDGKNITQWHNVVLFGKLAELAEKYLQKGSSVIIEGEIQYRDYLNKDGIKVYITEIIGNSMHFVGSKQTEAKPFEERPTFNPDQAPDSKGKVDAGGTPDSQLPF